MTDLGFSTGSLDCCICGWVEQYENNFESLLFLVERSEPENESQKLSEDIIFEPSILFEIYKQEL